MKIMKVAVVVGLAGALVLTGCDRTAQPGQGPYNNQPCIEADGEPCDDDPLDLDDLFEKKKKTPPPVKKTPAPKSTGKVRK